LMKQQVDALVAEEKLQQFLMWISQKSISVKGDYQLAAIRAFYFALALALDFDLALALDSNLKCDISRDLFNLDLDLDLKLIRDFNPDLKLELNSIKARELDRALILACDPELKHKLQLLKKQLPNREDNLESRQHWWEANGQTWTEELRVVMIQHRNIGHDWQFSEQQKASLSQYYNADLLLVECLNSDCYLSREVRSQIEDTLLLPIAEIEKRKHRQ
ncbi:MAG: signal transduction protein, partial [Coleofasciculus sp. S288]|nr:signal transduction protein [Coleofasciculus sp. S288]